MLLLGLVGVEGGDIAADYALSRERLRARSAALDEPDQGPLLEGFLADRGTSAAELITTMLRDLNIEAGLLSAGLISEDITALRRRLLDPRAG